ncbi:MAG TPA: hypothetical protein VN238_00070 [Solirubrobacteraceae bacterium]|nr:hypothetical protein [Solirubrobacteraceae bacterium]
MALLPFDEVRRRLGLSGQSYGGIREIPVEKIVGSVDRAADFGPGFTPRRGGVSRARLTRLRAAYPEAAPLPAIEVYEVGGLFFVEDGHHRVALARERGMAFLDAEVTVLHTRYAELPPDVDVARLVHTEQQRLLLEESGLAQARPDARIEFARPRGYPELLETIKAHGYDLARRAADGRLPEPAQVAADWHDTVFVPGLAAVERAGLPDRYPFKTPADLFLWVYERRRDLRTVDPDAGFDEAAAFVAREGVGRRDRRAIEREAAEPLRPRPPSV